jgi:putative membrane protein
LIIRCSKYQAATAIAVLFHLIGITGILFFNRNFFVQATPLNLLLMLALLVWTQKEKNLSFFVFMVLVLIVGTSAEMIGVNTGNLFGNYRYGNVLGPGIMNVPLVIGVNWFIIIYCCGSCIHVLMRKIIGSIAVEPLKKPATIKALSVVFDGATLAVFFDWVMEPVAIKLGFWHWAADGTVPLFNYLSWLVLSMLLLVLFHFGNFNKENKFAVNLLLVQAMFFLLLRTLLD